LEGKGKRGKKLVGREEKRVSCLQIIGLGFAKTKFFGVCHGQVRKRGERMGGGEANSCLLNFLGKNIGVNIHWKRFIDRTTKN